MSATMSSVVLSFVLSLASDDKGTNMKQNNLFMNGGFY